MTKGALKKDVFITIQGDNIKENDSVICKILGNYPGNWVEEVSEDDLLEVSGVCMGTYYEYQSFDFYEDNEYDEEWDYDVEDLEFDLKHDPNLQDLEVTINCYEM